jgi:hypothetical protein
MPVRCVPSKALSNLLRSPSGSLHVPRQHTDCVSKWNWPFDCFWLSPYCIHPTPITKWSCRKLWTVFFLEEFFCKLFESFAIFYAIPWTSAGGGVSARSVYLDRTAERKQTQMPLLALEPTITVFEPYTRIMYNGLSTHKIGVKVVSFKSCKLYWDINSVQSTCIFCCLRNLTSSFRTSCKVGLVLRQDE